MIAENALTLDELWAVIQDQRERVDRLVEQAGRQQEEIARLRGENRRLAALAPHAESRKAVTPAPRELPEPATNDLVPVVTAEAPALSVVDSLPSEIGSQAVNVTIAAQRHDVRNPGRRAIQGLIGAAVIAACGLVAAHAGQPSAAPAHAHAQVAAVER